MPYRYAKDDTEKLKEFLQKLNKDESALSKAKAIQEWLKDENHSPFLKNFIGPSFSAFNSKLYDNQRKGILLIPDIYDYFHEDYLMQKVGKRKLVDTVSGLFLSLGIIGTFFGIAVGVSQLKAGGDAESMRQGIEVLLSGMKVKFSSSIAGIVLL